MGAQSVLATITDAESQPGERGADSREKVPMKLGRWSPTEKMLLVTQGLNL